MFALITIIIKQYWKPILFALYFCLAPLFAGLYVWRGHTIELLQVSQAKLIADQQLATATAAAKAKTIEAGYQAKIAEVNENALLQIKAAYDAANNSRTSIISLREQTTAAASKLSNASQASTADYAITCGAILDAMAEVGGRIAAQADDQSIETMRILNAWPVDGSTPQD